MGWYSLVLHPHSALVFKLAAAMKSRARLPKVLLEIILLLQKAVYMHISHITSGKYQCNFPVHGTCKSKLTCLLWILLWWHLDFSLVKVSEWMQCCVLIVEKKARNCHITYMSTEIQCFPTKLSRKKKKKTNIKPCSWPLLSRIIKSKKQEKLPQVNIWLMTYNHYLS